MNSIDLQPQTRQHLHDRLNLTPTELQQLCQQWQIQEFALFGSILRSDFRPDSDIDILLTFQPQTTWTLFDIVHLQQDLEHRTGRKIDLAEKPQLQNPYRRAEILKTHRILYVSA
jgi:uncharacterized protein